jgi:hypothetical protein
LDRGGRVKRTALRSRSKKREAAMRDRRKLVAEMLERYPWCARCLWNRSVDLHELKNRSQGGDFLDPDQIVTVCRDCHHWIGANPLLAHEGGWTYWSHEAPDATGKNVPEVEE